MDNFHSTSGHKIRVLVMDDHARDGWHPSGPWDYQKQPSFMLNHFDQFG